MRAVYDCKLCEKTSLWQPELANSMFAHVQTFQCCADACILVHLLKLQADEWEKVMRGPKLCNSTD